MTGLSEALRTAAVPGAVALVARGDEVEVEVAGSVDVATIDAWNVLGRYGWVGGTGTAAYLIPATGTVTILLSQVELAGPTPPAIMRDFWRYASEV